ncbi:two-component sensor histidine kinase [Legionella taurinensis]|uniref:histidine kinase n=1 Tax=Legionella taurinensis TaxID=70611 RepID=A0A3A5L827_9GAMM|nr:ATP-binding protein [Legionella taurinensis]MDX1837115.1 ATP-binding protein [Legionella taurinensis]PUT40402.1 two-component sensor histidine kinase [Legionella taurinensis]PUT40507.1 two-component sensor histidine kinase [Legionella taurinensis]PUT42752.1 two-component sensor histidine kinase [Legionella taurinensis]PUT48463.1 two-component sensor histidine kinase [Legionella taurinensis]
MKSSIRKFLLINLLLAITITTTLTAIGNYYLDQKDIQEHLDTLMAISALSYQALLGDDLHERPLVKIQNNLEIIPQKIENYYQRRFLNDLPPKNYLDKFNFQVWTNGGKLLLHSSTAPKIPLTAEEDGFSDKYLSDQKWRVFTTYNDKAGIRTVLAERYDTRNELGHRIAQDDLYIMLLTFPLSGLLIWIIIGRGLDSLDRVAQEVANRAPTHLKPVDLEEVPEEIKPVIDELNKLFYRLQEGFEREKRFAADAAHELRTPLAALKAQAQVALNTNDLEEKNLALQKLIASVNRSTHIVQQLLTMSKLVPEANSLNDIDAVNLVKITREVLAMLAPSAVEKQIELEFEHEENLPDFAGNLTAISILIRNLVDNAIRYCKDAGKVLVQVYQKNDDIVLQVSDNGPGIPSELQSRVFERFFRVLGNKSPGSGLGLAIVRQITDLHGGKVELDSPKEGTGLIVRVYFPLHQDNPKEQFTE